jgi:hypothetical protein
MAAVITDLWQDFRYSLRVLAKQRAFAATAIFILALGIGATTAIFTVVNAVIIRPLPYPDSDALVRIIHVIGGIEQRNFSETIFLGYAENTQAFQDLGAFAPGSTATITGQGKPEEVPALTASRGVLTTLGVQPHIGRWFTPEEDAPGAADTVLLTTTRNHRRDARGFPLQPRIRDRAAAANRPCRTRGGVRANGRRQAEAWRHARAGQR